MKQTIRNIWGLSGVGEAFQPPTTLNRAILALCQQIDDYYAHPSVHIHNPAKILADAFREELWTDFLDYLLAITGQSRTSGLLEGVSRRRPSPGESTEEIAAYLEKSYGSRNMEKLGRYVNTRKDRILQEGIHTLENYPLELPVEYYLPSPPASGVERDIWNAFIHAKHLAICLMSENFILTQDLSDGIWATNAHHICFRPVDVNKLDTVHIYTIRGRNDYQRSTSGVRLLIQDYLRRDHLKTISKRDENVELRINLNYFSPDYRGLGAIAKEAYEEAHNAGLNPFLVYELHWDASDRRPLTVFGMADWKDLLYEIHTIAFKHQVFLTFHLTGFYPGVLEELAQLATGRNYVDDFYIE